MEDEESPRTHHQGLPGYDPNNIQPWMISVTFGTTAFTTLIVLLRVASRRIRKQRLWWDDYTIIFAMGWLFTLDMVNLGLFHQGVGIHIEELSPDKAVLTSKWLLAGGIFYVWNICWAKLSVLLMYYRIFDFPPFRRKAYWVAGLVIAWTVCAMFLFIFICAPTAKIWKPEIPGHCLNKKVVWLSTGVSTIITDIMILFMPIRQIWKLRLQTSEKLGLSLIMGLGCFVIAASSYRLFVLMTYNREDSTYTLAPTLTWSVVEVAVSIISACLPTLLPVLRACTNKLGIRINFLSSLSLHGGGGGGGADSVALNGAAAANGQGHSKSNHRNGNVGPNPLVTIGQQSSRRQTGDSFFRLSDDEAFGLGDEHRHHQDRDDDGAVRRDGHSPDCIMMHSLPQETKPQSPISI